MTDFHDDFNTVRKKVNAIHAKKWDQNSALKKAKESCTVYSNLIGLFSQTIERGIKGNNSRFSIYFTLSTVYLKIYSHMC